MGIGPTRLLMRDQPLVEQFEDLDKQAAAARLGMWAFLGSEVLLFTGLFALYAGYRTMYPIDFARAVAHDNVAIGTINTVVLLTSSQTVALAVRAIRMGRARLAAGLLGASVVLGLVFLALKAVEYGEHFREGIYPGSAYRLAELPTYGAKTFFGIYYLATGLHALHVTAGMCVLAVLGWAC